MRQADDRKQRQRAGNATRAKDAAANGGETVEDPVHAG